VRRFGKPGGLRACAAFGGLSKLDQFKDLKAGCEVCLFQHTASPA
jgi:ATP-dependent RNA helicase DDX42